MTDLTETAVAAPLDPAEPDAVVERPDHVPEKFWDAKAGEIRIEALTKSYCDLERRMGRMVMPPELPETADGYAPELPDGMERAPEIEDRMLQAGFTNGQVQLVYEMAAEVLGPMADANAADREQAALVAHFGSDADWQGAARDIRDWGRASLPGDVYQVLSASAEGVKAMHAMMGSTEPRLGAGAETSSLDKAGLRKLMDDPRYWRDGDPDLVARVRDGFAALSQTSF